MDYHIGMCRKDLEKLIDALDFFILHTPSESAKFDHEKDLLEYLRRKAGYVG